MYNKFKPKFLSIGLISCLFLFSFFYGFFDNEIVVIELEEDPRATAQRVYHSHGHYQLSTNSCILPKLDPWDPLIRKEMHDPGPRASDCQPSIQHLTTLKDGVLRVENKYFWLFSPRCFYRCLHPVNDVQMKVDKWAKIDLEQGSRPGCDVVEVECRKTFGPKYSYIHTQIVERPKPSNEEVIVDEDGNVYNFYWLILDSVSMSMFKRAMHKTIKVLREEFEAVEFTYLNKIGMNSRANAYGFFFGIPPSNNSMETKLCNTPLDSMPYAGFDFEQSGFYTHETEDFWTGALDWPNCIGFQKPHADHFMRPFWLTVGYSSHGSYAKSPETRQQLWQDSCKTEHNYVMEQFLQFAGAYPNKRKFSMAWMVDLAHDSNPRLFDADHEFAEYFKELNEKSKNSFIFFQADHGMRWKNVRNIPVIGELEDSNPFLYVVVPERLRTNPSLMQNLRHNGGQLISHLDLYASAVQVAKFSHTWTPTTDFDQPMTPIANRTFIGSSIFHRMNQPRTCENIGVPLQYCMCSKELKTVKDTELAKRVAQTLVNYLNQDLKDYGFEKKCLKHRLFDDYEAQLEEYPQKEPNIRIFRAKFMTLPGRALYQGTVKMHANKSLSLMYANFPRLNSYAQQARCIPEQFMRNYCVCP